MVALRNIVDGEDIDLVADLATILGPLAGPAAVATKTARILLGRLADDAQTVRDALARPLTDRLERLEAGLARLDERLDALEAAPRRRPPVGRAR